MPVNADERNQQNRQSSQPVHIEPFNHLPEFPFVICKRCKVGFVASEAGNHLKSKHGNISRIERQRIKQTVATYESVAKDQAELRGWVVPSPTISPNIYIKPPQKDGLGCDHCTYVVREIQQMQKHCRIEHGWVNDWKRGGNVRYRAQQERPPVPWRSGVYCQQICHWGHGRRWFEVGRDETDTQRHVARSEEEEQRERQEQEDHKEAVDFLDRICNEANEAFETEDKAAIQDGDDKHEAERWLNRCGWPRYLEGIRRDELRAKLQPISDDEPVLQRMWEIFERVLDKAYATASQCYPGTAELLEIERKEVHTTTDTPFQGLMEPDAWARYKAWWKTLLSLWKRLESWPAEVDDSSSDNDTDNDGSSSSSSSSSSNGFGSNNGIGDQAFLSQGPRPPYRMTIRQEELWKEFEKGVTAVVIGADRAGRYTPERLECSCLDAVVQFFDHPFKNGNHYESIVIGALAIMGVDRENGGGWVAATNYTPIYSAVIKVARYLVLYQSIVERHRQIAQLQPYMSVRQAEEEAIGLFKIVRGKVERFMTRVPGGPVDPTPMNWIINTRAYGMKIRYTTPGSETIDWRGDKIIHGRVRLGMGELADMLNSLVQDARRTLVQLATGKVEDEEGQGRRRGMQRKWISQMQARKEEDEDDVVTLPRIPWLQIEDRHGESGLGIRF